MLLQDTIVDGYSVVAPHTIVFFNNAYPRRPSLLISENKSCMHNERATIRKSCLCSGNNL